MAILTANDPQKYAKQKQVEIDQLAVRAISVMDNLVGQLEQFTGYAFSEFADPNGLVDQADLTALTAIFEAKRASVQALMDRLNAISAVAGPGVLPADIPANAQAFITAIGYNHATYSAQFNKP